MEDSEFPDTTKDIICIFILFNIKQLSRSEISEILNYSNEYIKRKVKDLELKDYLKSTYIKGKVVYMLNEKLLNQIRKEFLSYCLQREKELKKLVEKYKYKKGLVGLKTFQHEELKTNKHAMVSLSHEEVKYILKELGLALDYRVESEYEAPICGDARFDIVWIKHSSPVPKKVFEVVKSEDRDNILRALTNVNCASKSFNAIPIVVVANKNIYGRVKQLLETPNFEELRKKIRIIDAEDLLALKKLINIINALISD